MMTDPRDIPWVCFSYSTARRICSMTAQDPNCFVMALFQYPVSLLFILFNGKIEVTVQSQPLKHCVFPRHGSIREYGFGKDCVANGKICES